MVLHLIGYGVVPDNLIERAIPDLSSPLIDLIRVEGTTVKRTSLKMESRLSKLGEAGEEILSHYEVIAKKFENAT